MYVKLNLDHYLKKSDLEARRASTGPWFCFKTLK